MQNIVFGGYIDIELNRVTPPVAPRFVTDSDTFVLLFRAHFQARTLLWTHVGRRFFETFSRAPVRVQQRLLHGFGATR